MECTSPYTGYRAVEGGLTTSVQKGYPDRPLTVRCGRCIGCRIHRSHVWAIRCVHEASLYENNIFATLTYDDEHLPADNGLNRKHLQDFFKRLRKKHPANKIRTFYCGEYGDQTNRPHYHAIIFNYAPSDRELMFVKNGNQTYRSDKLDALWKHGHVNFGDVTLQSAAYVAGYVIKKKWGEQQKEFLQWTDENTGEVFVRQPQFQGQSLKPGIGEPYVRQWLQDIYPRSEIIVEGVKRRPPRYYDQMCEKLDPHLWRETLKRRAQKQPKLIEITRHDGTKTKVYDKPETYKGTERQMLCKKKINESRQIERDPDK